MRSKVYLNCFLILVIFSLSSKLCSGQVVIDADANATIVISKTPSETERFAAKELRKYIHEMTGVYFPIRNDRPDTWVSRHGRPLLGAGDGLILAVGANNYSRKYKDKFDRSLIKTGNDSFVISVQDNLVILAGGGDRGTIYSIYELFEQQGYRWFFPGKAGEVAPKKRKIILQNGEKTYEPDFVQRSIDVYSVGDIAPEDVIDWCVKNRLNWAFNLREFHLRRKLPMEKWDAFRKRGGQLSFEWVAHNIHHMLPNEKYFDEHPEYYSLYQGKRLKFAEHHNAGGNACTTNRDVIRICADFIIKWFDDNPDGMVVPLFPADGAVKWCECENCMKLGGVNSARGPEGSMSRRMVVFANEVARLVYPKYPDRYILCPAYSMYLEPVPDISLEKNVLVQYCPLGSYNRTCYAHGVAECPVNDRQKKQIEAWAKAAPNRIGIWEYSMIGDYDYAEEITPGIQPIIYRTRDLVRFLKSQGFTFYFTQTGSQHWKYNQLLYYMTAKLLWDPEANFDVLWKDYFEKMYGPAAEPVSKFYRLIEDATAKADWHPEGFSEVVVPSPKVFTDQLLVQAEKYIKQAESEKISRTVAQRVKLVRQNLDYIKAEKTK